MFWSRKQFPIKWNNGKRLVAELCSECSTSSLRHKNVIINRLPSMNAHFPCVIQESSTKKVRRADKDFGSGAVKIFVFFVTCKFGIWSMACAHNWLRLWKEVRYVSISKLHNIVFLVASISYNTNDLLKPTRSLLHLFICLLCTISYFTLSPFLIVILFTSSISTFFTKLCVKLTTKIQWDFHTTSFGIHFKPFFLEKKSAVKENLLHCYWRKK